MTLVPPEGVPGLWGSIVPLLEPAVRRARGRFIMPDVYEALTEGHEQLWVAYETETGQLCGVATTSFAFYPGRKNLFIHFLGGKGFKDWGKQGLELLTAWARDNRCQGIEAWGREGFSRMLDGEGYRQAYIVFEKEL